MKPTRVWIHTNLAGAPVEVEHRTISLWRHALDVALCWLHDRLASPPVRWSQKVRETQDWKRWCETAEGAGHER